MKDKYRVTITTKKGFEEYYNIEENIIKPIREIAKNKDKIKEIKIYYHKKDTPDDPQ
jgi:hypothetical protein